jgi:hypothetical protein
LTASLVIGLLLWESLHLRDNYLGDLKFPKALCNGETNEGEGKYIVWYHAGIDTTGVDWWYITWVFTQGHPTNLACVLDFMSEVDPKAMKTMMEAIAGAPTCRFPPIAGCATLCTNRLQFY